MNDKSNLTFWQSIVYNVDIDHIEKIVPSNDNVAVFKEGIASIIDMFADIRNKAESWDVKRLASIAITKLEEACMFGVKTLTYNK